jgi:hypothetical protein
MARARRWFLRLFLVVVLIVVAVVVAAPLIPLSAFRPAVERKLSETLGRTVTVDSVRLNLVSGPYLTITGMTAREDPAFGDGVFLSSQEVRADLDIVQYLRTRHIVIEAMTVKSPQIHLVKSAAGAWSWTTIGRRPTQSTVAPSSLIRAIRDPASSSLFQLAGDSSAVTFRKMTAENALVMLTDRTTSDATQTFYKSVSLSVHLAPGGTGDSGPVTEVKGEFSAQSEEDGQAELFRAVLPVDLRMERIAPSTLSVSGSIGPGPLETKNISIAAFALNGQISAERGAPLVGSGRLAAQAMLIHPINLSAKVAEALKINQIGDMSPGTSVGDLETDFQMAQGLVTTTGLHIKEIDGLGDATARNGSFKIGSALTVSYAATITLAVDATSRLKSASTMLGLLATVFETDNRLSVPINIKGDVRKPEIHVDVSRIF